MQEGKLTHIRDKTLGDFLKDLSTLKPGELWRILASIVGLFVFLCSGAFGAGYTIGKLEERLELSTYKLTLERRTELLSEALRQSAGELHERIRDELGRKDGK